MTRTYLLLQLDSEGASYADVAETLQDLGFKPQREGYDFEYDWGRDVSVGESLEFADRVQAALRGKRVGFRVETDGEAAPPE